jgi:uncharacterized protein with PIN domain
VERFLVDHMLMRLGRWLRLVGMYVANPEVIDDLALLSRAKQEKRILVTRDKTLIEACRTSGLDSILIHSSDIENQLAEMARFGIILKINPKRCTICNAPLRLDPNLSVPKEVWRCQECGKGYWKGTHWQRIEETLEKIRHQELNH